MLCIYNDGQKCSSDEITISFGGQCASCILPDFPDEVVEICKRELLAKFAGTHAKWDELPKK